MKTHCRGFKIYWIIGVAILCAGCASTKDRSDKLSTLLRVHLESQPNQMISRRQISVHRSSPLTLDVESLCLLTEENVVRASVVEQMGTYAIQIQFDQWAVPLLEHNSSSFQGRRIAIQAQWGHKQEHTRWLAAPKMNQRIANGLFTFTPDASLEECHEIVAGLNNNARKAKKQLQW